MKWALKENMFDGLGSLTAWACGEFFGGEVGEFPF